MNITDELRKWARQFRRVWVDPHSGDLTYITNEHACPPSLDAMRLEDYITAIADRIDAEHQRAIASVMNDALYHANEKDMAELGWIRLPVDADGESWRLGDELMMEGEVCEVVGIGGKTIFYAFGDGVEWTIAHNNRHHHAPTVEDVLREMCLEIDRRCERGSIDYDELFAEYAARLRLREDE